MKKVALLCCFLLAAVLVIAGQQDFQTSGKDGSAAPTIETAGSPAEISLPVSNASAEALAKDRYYYLIERLNQNLATDVDITELREISYLWNFPLPEELNIQTPAPQPFDESWGRDDNPLDQGGTDTVANCASATVIVPTVCPFSYYDTGTFDGDNDCGTPAASPSNEVFYTLTPLTTGNYAFRARSGSGGAAAIRIMSGGCCAGSTSIAFSSSSVATDCPRPDSSGNEPTTVVTYLRATLTAGTQYWIHVGTSSATSSSAAYQFQIACVPCPPEESAVAHNTCATAQVIACGDSILGDSSSAANPDWYQVTLAIDESLKVFVGGREWGHCNSGLYPGGTGVDGRFTIFRNCAQTCSDSVGFGGDEGCSFDAKKSVCLAAGTYYIKVWNNNLLEYVLKVDCGPACTPAPVSLPTNDLCANAITVPVPSSTNGTTVCATTDVVPTCGSGYTAGSPSVWYKVIGNGNTLTADLCTSSYDTRLAVYTGTCGTFTCVVGDDDACTAPNGLGSQVIWCSDVGVEYFLYVNAFSSTGSGTFTLNVVDGANCHIDCGNYPPCGTPSETEPNDSCFWAANFLSLACNSDGTPAFYYGTICPAADVDYYQVPGVSLGQIVRIRLFEGANCDVFPPVGLRMRGATGAGGSCGPATGTATTSYVLGTNCVPFTGGYIGVVRNTGFENKYKIEVTCSTAAIPECPNVVLPKQYCAGPCVGPIPDVTTVEYSIYVPLNEVIDDVNVRVNIVHTFDADIDMWLITPWSDTLELTTDNGGGGDNFQVTVFDDEGANGPVTAGVAPFNGSYIPEELLAAADGNYAEGGWRLRITDDVGGDVGFVNCWCLEFESHVPCTPTFVDFTRFPIPQYACADLCAGAGSYTLIRICQPGGFDPAKPPIVTVATGCDLAAGSNCNRDCPPADFTYDPSAWFIEPEGGCWVNTSLTALTNGCVCVSLEGFLAVNLNSFSAIAGDSRVTLAWSTATETNHDYFEVLRNETKVAELEGQGSPSSGGDYAWTDNGLVNGTLYHYTLVAVDVNGNRGTLGTIDATPVAPVVVTEYALHQNYPNPFNPATSITFDLVESGFVSLKVYNMLGQEIAVVVNGVRDAGRHVVTFDAAGMPSGLYLYRIEANGFVTQRKMLLMK